MSNVGIFKIEYQKKTQGKRTITKKIFHFICEFQVEKNNTIEKLIHYKKLYKDFNYYFCEADNDGYYYYNTNKKRIQLEGGGNSG